MAEKEKCNSFVESLHVPETVEIAGFETADDSVHMLEWMRRGRDFRRFVVHDIEAELYAQDPGSQLLFVNCTVEPKFETEVKTNDLGKHGMVTKFFVSFLISLRIRAANGVVWRLAIEQAYQAMNIDVPNNFQLRSNFTILDHQAEA